MAKQSSNKDTRELSLGDEFTGVTLRKSDTGSLTVDLSAFNGVDVTIITDSTVQPNPEPLHAPRWIFAAGVLAFAAGCAIPGSVPPRDQRTPMDDMNDTKGNEPDVIYTSLDKRAYRIGDVLPDGWVVGPRSPKTGIVMSLEPVSGALDGYKTWYQGEDHAKELREQGHANARQPSADNNNDELNAIYNEVVKAGRNDNARLNTFDFHPFGKYWSGTTGPVFRGLARIQSLGSGLRFVLYKDDAFARVRCVRDEPGLTLA